MKTKIKSLIAVLIFLVPVITFAQGRGMNGNMNTDEKAEQMSKHMYAQLDLSKEQLKKVEKINLEYVAKMEKVRQDNEQARTKFRSQMKDLHDEHENALKEVLTEEQYKELLKMQQRRQHDDMHRKGDGGRKNK